MKLLQFMGTLLDRLFVVLGAFAGSQIPPFMQQYQQRLAGHVEELNHLLNQLRQIAADSGKSLEQYIQKFVSNGDPDFVRQGEFMQGVVNRWQELHQALYHLGESSIWSRPYVFVKELHYDIAHSTFMSFQPGMSLTIEGLCYTGIGILVGLTLYQILAKCLTVGGMRAVAIFKQSV